MLRYLRMNAVCSDVPLCTCFLGPSYLRALTHIFRDWRMKKWSRFLYCGCIFMYAQHTHYTQKFYELTLHLAKNLYRTELLRHCN